MHKILPKMRLFAFSFFHYLVLKSTSRIFQRWKRTQFHEVRSERAQNTAWHDVTGNGNLHLPLNAGYHFEEVDGLKKNWEFAKLKPQGTSMKKRTKHKNIKTKLQSSTRLEYQTFWGQSTRQRSTKQCIKNGHCPLLLVLPWCNRALLCHRSYFFCIKLHKILFCIKSILLQLDSPWREAEGPGLTVTLKVRHQRYHHLNYSPISTYPQIKITLKKP